MSETTCPLESKTCGCQNLDDNEVRKRKTLAYASFLAAFALVGYQKVAPGAAWLSWMPAVPFFVGFLGLFQAQTRTCVALAFIDRDMSEGKMAPVPDRDTAWRLKKRSVKLVASAGVLACLAAAICQKL